MDVRRVGDVARARDELIARPLLAVLAGLILGLTAGLQWVAWLAVTLVMLWSRDVRFAVALVLACALGVLLRPQPGGELLDHVPYAGRADVITMPRDSGSRQVATVRTEIGTLRLRTPPDAAIGFGDRLWIEGEVRPVQTFELGGGIVGRIGQPSIRIDEEGPAIWRIAPSLRHSFREWSARSLSPDASMLVDAVCFNATDRLSEEMSTALMRAGTLHVVSTSGLHVMLLASALAWLLAFAPLPRLAQIGVLAALLVLYVGAAGVRPPALRAALMVLVLLPSYAWRREGDGLSALALAATVILLWQPHAVYDIGLHLSLACMFGLILWWMWRGSEPVSTARRSCEASVAATLASAPLLAYYGSEVSIVAVVGNLLAAFLVPPLLGLSLLGWLASWVDQGLGLGIAKALVEPLAQALEWWMHTLSGLPFAAFFSPPVPVWWLVVLYGVVVLVWRPRARPA